MTPCRGVWLVGVLAFLLAAWGTVAHAHKPSDSYLTLAVPASSGILEGQWDIALRDLDFVLGLDTNRDGAITWGELKAARSRIADYAFTRLTLEGLGRGDRSACPARLTGTQRSLNSSINSTRMARPTAPSSLFVPLAACLREP